MQVLRAQVFRLWVANCCSHSDPPMNTMRMVVFLESCQLSCQIGRIPEQYAIEKLPTDSANRPFNERMRNGGLGNSLDCLGFEAAQVGKPAMKSK